MSTALSWRRHSFFYFFFYFFFRHSVRGKGGCWDAGGGRSESGSSPGARMEKARPQVRHGDRHGGHVRGTGGGIG